MLTEINIEVIQGGFLPLTTKAQELKEKQTSALYC